MSDAVPQMPRRFTVRDAEGLLPLIGDLLRDAVTLRSEYQEAEQFFSSITQRIMMLGGVALDRQQAAKMRAVRDRSGDRLKKTLENIQETGCVVKDLDIGLVDFPTLFQGREVYLCWKLGEPAIQYWHGVDEGFAGRKPIDQEFLEQHRGDAAH